MTCRWWNTYKLMQVIGLPTRAVYTATATFFSIPHINPCRNTPFLFPLKNILRGVSMNSRVLTISGVSPYTDSKGRFVVVPLIRLQGKWLEALGFCPRCRVKVLEYQNKLIIELVKEDLLCQELGSTPLLKKIY